MGCLSDLGNMLMDDSPAAGFAAKREYEVPIDTVAKALKLKGQVEIARYDGKKKTLIIKIKG